MKKIPLALILLRLLLAPVMLLWARGVRETGWFPVTCLWVGMLSDIFDGIIARHLKVADDRLRKWDAQVDVVFWLAAGITIWIINGRLLHENLPWIILLFILEPVSDIINLARFGRGGCAHNWASKLWGIVLLITFSILLEGGEPRMLFDICLALGVLSQLDRIIISSLLRKPECDIPSFYQAYRRRQGKTFKRYKLFN